MSSFFVQDRFVSVTRVLRAAEIILVAVWLTGCVSDKTVSPMRSSSGCHTRAP